MKIFLTGGEGRLGREIKKLVPDAYAPTHVELDLLDYKKTIEAVVKYSPDAIIHCAGITDVMKAEKERALCWNTNITATRNLLTTAMCVQKPTHFTYVSTACVFRGDVGDYTEKDVPYPSNFYGLTKLLAEQHVCTHLKPWLIVRTNFVSRGPWAYDRAFTDRFGTYLYADEVAQRILDLVKSNYRGLKHVCGDTKLSMFELAQKYSPDVKPYTLKDFYIEHPDAPTLTRDMSLRTVRQ